MAAFHGQPKEGHAPTVCVSESFGSGIPFQVQRVPVWTDTKVRQMGALVAVVYRAITSRVSLTTSRLRPRR